MHHSKMIYFRVKKPQNGYISQYWNCNLIIIALAINLTIYLSAFSGVFIDRLSILTLSDLTHLHNRTQGKIKSWWCELCTLRLVVATQCLKDYVMNSEKSFLNLQIKTQLRICQSSRENDVSCCAENRSFLVALTSESRNWQKLSRKDWAASP